MSSFYIDEETKEEVVVHFRSQTSPLQIAPPLELTIRDDSYRIDISSPPRTYDIPKDAVLYIEMPI